MEVTVGLEQAVGLGWDSAWKKSSQEECVITHSRPVELLCHLTFLYSFTDDSLDLAPHQEEVPRS